jgi:dephospho-CoA kinase
MEPGRPVYEEIVRHFGREILNSDGTISRPKLAQAAFGGDTPRVLELNAIVHPAVIRQENEFMGEVARRDPKAIAVVEAALILEAGGADRFDHLVVVTCHPEQRVRRFAERLGLSEEVARAEVERRMAAQIPDEEKIKAADVVIDNSGSLESTEQQVKKAFAKWEEELRRGS